MTIEDAKSELKRAYNELERIKKTNTKDNRLTEAIRHVEMAKTCLDEDPENLNDKEIAL